MEGAPEAFASEQAGSAYLQQSYGIKRARRHPTKGVSPRAMIGAHSGGPFAADAVYNLFFGAAQAVDTDETHFISVCLIRSDFQF